jgi:AcrR family transcriptional regulator
VPVRSLSRKLDRSFPRRQRCASGPVRPSDRRLDQRVADREDRPAAGVHGAQSADGGEVVERVAVDGQDVGIEAGSDPSFTVPEPAGLGGPGGHRLEDLGWAYTSHSHVAGGEAAKRLFTEHGYPATTIEAIAETADTPLPTVYRLFGSKRALLAAVLDSSFGGDDQPIAFGDRPAVRAARAETDPVKMVNAFARIIREFMERSSAILQVLATAAQVDPDAAALLAEIRRQRHAGQSRIVAALADTGALDAGLDKAEAADMVYALLSPDVHRILTVERGWPADRYERWIARSLAALLPAGQRPPANPAGARQRTRPANRPSKATRAEA